MGQSKRTPSDRRNSSSATQNATGGVKREASSSASKVAGMDPLAETGIKRQASGTEKSGFGETSSTLTGDGATEPPSAGQEGKSNPGLGDTSMDEGGGPIPNKTESKPPSSDTSARGHSGTTAKKDGDSATSKASESPHESVETAATAESGGWSLSDSKLATDAAFALRNSEATRPSFVTISGTRWTESDLLRCLSTVSHVECPVYLTPRDTLWRPSKEGREKTRARIEALLSEGYKCEVLLVWGALDLPTIQSLPNSVSNIAIALSDRNDMDLVHELDKRSNQLKFIHLSFSKKFKSRHWERRTLPPKTQNDVSTCLHFPELTKEDFEWMKSIISVVVPRPEDKSLVWGAYFPSSSVSADAVLAHIMDAGLQCKVFLSASRAPKEGEVKKVMKKYKRHKCSVEWILEDV